MTEAKGNIGKAILKVMEEVGYVQKEKAAGLNYSFAGEAALIAVLRPAMIEAGVFCYIYDLPSIEQVPYVTSKGTGMNRSIVHGIVRFSHPGSGTYIDVHAMGEGADIGDKAGNKAATGLLKYALRQTFLIETGDDPDKTPSEEQERLTPTEPTPQTGWPPAFVTELKDEGIVKQKNHAISLLNLSPFNEHAKLEDVMRWAAIYRARREEGLKTKEAASIATEEYKVSQ